MPRRRAPVAEKPLHRPFDDLHPKDQQIKQTKKLCIEKNWECPIEECLPAAIRPRVEPKKGAKVRVGDPVAVEEKWWNWSVELLKSVEELSSMTEGELEYAQELLEIEVEQRQNNPKSGQRKILELLLGDAQKVNDEQRKRLAVRYSTDGMELTADTMDTRLIHAGYPQTPGPQQIAGAGAGASAGAGNHASHSVIPAPHNDIPSNMDMDFPIVQGIEETHRRDGDTHSEFDRFLSPPPSGADEDHHDVDFTGGRLRITELRAHALRLKAQALRLDAEAAELEAEADEIREELLGQGA